MIPPQIERWVKETYKKPQIAEVTTGTFDTFVVSGLTVDLVFFSIGFLIVAIG